MRQADFCFEFLAKYGPEGERVSKIPFPFFCLICGFWPVCICIDGNRKCTFSLKGLDFSNVVAVCQ